MLPILPAKLYPPPASAGLIVRPAVLARLHAGVQGKVTIVSAPPGFGKTTCLPHGLPPANPPTSRGMRSMKT